MSNDVLNNLLQEYDRKRTLKQLDLEKRKKDLYDKIPRLREIEYELNMSAINTTKAILHHLDYSLSDLNDKIEILKNEKNKILKDNGYDSSYLLPSYDCSLCNDTGYIKTEHELSSLCPCLKQKLLDISYNKSNISSIKKDTFENFNETLYSNEVDLSKYGQNISPRTNIVNIKNDALSFIENFDDPLTKNLLFTGNTGLRENFYF